MGLLTILTGRQGQAEIAQRAKTRELIKGIEALAPKNPSGVRYVSATLAGDIEERSGFGDQKISDSLVRTMGFARGDNLSVYLSPRFRNDPYSSLILQRMPRLDRKVVLNFDPQTLRFNGYEVEIGGLESLEPTRNSAINKDQKTLVGVLQAIHDDLVDGRAGWINGAGLARAAWVDKISQPFAETQAPIARLDRMLRLIENAFPGQAFMVFGESTDSRPDPDPGKISLYTTLDLVNGVEGPLARIRGIHSLYAQEAEIIYSRDVPRNIGKVQVHFGDGIDVTLETFKPDGRETRMPYLEEKFAHFLAGKRSNFNFEGTSGIDSRVRAVLLSSSPDNFAGSKIFADPLKATAPPAIAVS